MVNYFPNFKNSFSKGIYYLKIKIIYRWVFKYINKKDIKKDKLLEVGFGPGIFADIILSKYPKSDYHGIDYDNNAIEYFAKQGFDIVPYKNSYDENGNELTPEYQNSNDLDENESIDTLYGCKNLDFEDIKTKKYKKCFKNA